MLLEKKDTDFKNYAIAFLVFLISIAISFFLGLRIGKNIAKEKLKQEITRARETEIEEVLAGITETKKQQKNENTSLQQYGDERIQEESEKEERDKTTSPDQVTPVRLSQPEIQTHPPTTQVQNNTSAQNIESQNIKSQLQKDRKKEQGQWSIQLASFQSKERADIFAKSMKVKYKIPTYVTKANTNSKTVWRVKVGKFKDKKEAEKFLAELRKKGINGQMTK